jgi:hypothetical protein
MVWLHIPRNPIKFEIILKAMIYYIIFQRSIKLKKFSQRKKMFFMGPIYETLDFPWRVFQWLQGRGHSYNPYYLMWKPMQKQITPRKYGIAWVKYTIDPKTRI